MGETAATVKAYVAQHQLSFLHLLDPDLKVASLLAIHATPTNFLTDRTGRVLGGGAGYRDWSGTAAHHLIQSLLKNETERASEKR